MNILNWIVGWFGYQWVVDTKPYPRQDNPRVDEGWDDLFERNPRYILQKKSK